MRAALSAGLIASTASGWRPPPTASQTSEGDRPSFDQPPKVRPAPGLRASLFAMEPLVADPVAFTIDEKGRFLIAESARQELGVEDNRSSRWWLNDDLQCRTIEDRLRMYEKWASKREGGMAYYRAHDDRVRMIEDTDGDGRADRGTIFAGPFNEPLDGTGAGVIAKDGDVWYTNIPHLWRLRDRDGDGIAEEREAVHTGFGVRVALRGHDMHGLTWGPDGRLYWSIGDRGYHVTLPDGRVLSDPQSGAVFRCEADGSGLEVFHYSLRNPQELAFDDLGNLVTGDNNSDGGDKARIVYVVEGGHTGWSMNYQTLEGANLRGPWNQEDIWALRPELAPDKVSRASAVQPAWTIPPLDHVGSGPSGLVHYPGLGLPDRYRDAFFLCDFLGGDAYSRVLSFRLEPVGAGYRVADVHPFVENVLPTDVDFGYDGRFYVSNWAGGWYSNGKGEIYAVWDPERIDDPRIAQVERLFREGFAGRDPDELVTLLSHTDQRVRLRSQFALADWGPAAAPLFLDTARHATDRLGRLHAIWGLGMLARLERDGSLAAPLLGLLDDGDPEVRGQAAKVLGESGVRSAIPALERQLSDATPRARYFAAMALGRLSSLESAPAIVAMLAESDGADVFLRHAGVHALAAIGDRTVAAGLSREPQVELRLVAALLYRAWRDPSLGRMLGDPNPAIVAEATRAIHDLRIEEAMPALRRLASTYGAVAADNSDQVRDRFRRERWTEVAGGGGADLSDPATFAGGVSIVEEVDEFAGAPRAGDRYLQRVSGLVTAPADGEYRFLIASDDHSVVLVSDGEDPSRAQPVASVQGYSGRGDFSGQANQVSRPIRLEKGNRYWIEARHAEGGGDDHLTVGWMRPDGSVEAPIGAGIARPHDAPILRRVINALFRNGTSDDAAAMASIAANPANPAAMRLEAMSALAEWLQPSPRDRVHGAWDPVDAMSRDADGFKQAMSRALPGLIRVDHEGVRSAARDLAASLGVGLDPEMLLRTVADADSRPADRLAALRAALREAAAVREQALMIAGRSELAELRVEASIANIPNRAAEVDTLRAMLMQGSDAERRAVASSLQRLDADVGETLIGEAFDAMVGDELPRSIHLEVMDAASSRSPDTSPLPQRAAERLVALDSAGGLGRHVLALEGGDAAMGDRVVHQHASAVCLKCHAIDGFGGNAAPELRGVANRLTREQILESLVYPNARVAEGFGPVSAMPGMASVLSPREMRDVVEYLTTLR
jgi:putative membrane-bound dehydrogenase-like protein